MTRQTRVEVRAYPAGATDDGTERVRFEVEDTGIGVPTNKRKSIFEEFQQADSSLSHQHPGTGVDLAISRRLVEVMNGEIGLDSTEGGGSLFWFTLPLERVHNAEWPDRPAPTVRRI